MDDVSNSAYVDQGVVGSIKQIWVGVHPEPHSSPPQAEPMKSTVLALYLAHATVCSNELGSAEGSGSTHLLSEHSVYLKGDQMRKEESEWLRKQMDRFPCLFFLREMASGSCILSGICTHCSDWICIRIKGVMLLTGRDKTIEQ